MKKTPVFWVLWQIRGRIPAIMGMTAAQVCHALFCVFFALGSRAIIDSAVAGQVDEFTLACVRQMGTIAGILISGTVFRHLRDKLHAQLERDWKKHLLHGLLRGDYAAVSEYHSGELLNRLNNDVNKINEGILTTIPSAAAMLTRLIAAVVVLGVLDLRFMLLIGAVGLVVIIATGLMRQRLKELNKQVSTHDGKVSGFLQEILEKLLIVQAMDVSDEVEIRTEKLLDDRYDLQRKRKNASLMINTGVSLLTYGAGFLALCWCGYRLLQGQLSFGSLTAIIQLVNQLQAPFVGLSGVFPQYVAMNASAERLMELEKIQNQPQSEPRKPDELYSRMEKICAENLQFAYDRELVFSDASFSLPKGSFTVITGQSGIGKSTILKLLLGIFRPEKGRIYIDCGSEKETLDRTTRCLFAYVPQGNLLFSGTIRENLLIVRPEATDQELAQAMYVSTMDEVLLHLPQGLDTRLGESGMGLSEGQGQRLAIARAVLTGAPVLLLDECTSALDEQTERKVIQRLRELRNRTCIAVTHRSAAVELCDLRIEVQDGKILVVQQND